MMTTSENEEYAMHEALRELSAWMIKHEQLLREGRKIGFEIGVSPSVRESLLNLDSSDDCGELKMAQQHALANVGAYSTSAVGADSFQVRVQTMTESHRQTYWVELINKKTRPANPGIFDKSGLIHPAFFEIQEHAQHTAAEWAEFLGVPHQVQCSCLMCDVKKR